MKLLDTIFEDENKEKLIKRAKTIYKAFKSGKFKVDNHGQTEDALFSYILSDDPTIIKFENLSENTDVFIRCEIFIKRLNEVANQTMTKRGEIHIKNKFKQHGIDIKIQVWTYNIEPYVKPTEPINEDAEVDVPKEKRRVKTVFKALRSGVMFVPFLGYKIKYELNNDYQLSVGIGKSHNDTILFVPSDDKSPKIKLYEIGSDGVERYFEVNGYDSIYQMMWQKISDRFKHFHIHLR